MKPESIKDVIDGVIKNLAEENVGVNEDQILKIWKAVCGKKLAGHSKPVAFKSKRLIVNVDSSGWLYELSLKKREILSKLKRKFKKKPLEELQFRIGEI